MSSRDEGLNRWVKIDEHSFVASVVVADPSGRCASIEILVRAETRGAVVAKLKAIGHHSIRLVTNIGPPPPEDLSIILTSDSDMLWRPWREGESWHRMDDLG